METKKWPTWSLQIILDHDKLDFRTSDLNCPGVSENCIEYNIIYGCEVRSTYEWEAMKYFWKVSLLSSSYHAIECELYLIFFRFVLYVFKELCLLEELIERETETEMGIETNKHQKLQQTL